jgi:hypothetical protein
MQITFDPHNPDDLATVARLLGTTAAAPANIGDEDRQMPVTVQPEEPTYSATDTDIHGMTHDGEIHSTPPSKNADGSWRARRGRKDEYEAAIARHTAARTADAGAVLAVTAPTMQQTRASNDDVAHGGGALATTMPEPAAPAMPAIPAPAAPPAPIAYEAMGTRFMARYTAGTLPVPYEQIYADLGVLNPTDTTNQTQIAKIWHYLDGLDNGMDHAGAVRHAMGMV